MISRIISILNRSRLNRIVLGVLLAGCIFSGSANTEEMNKESPFGVLAFLHWNHPWNNHKYPDEKSLKKAAALMREAGISWVRMDFLWDEIEPRKGEFDFTKYDRIVELLSASGINILGLLEYNCAWDGEAKKWNDPPQDNRLFVNYAVKVISRYKGKIKHWEVWNEPDSSIYWSRQDSLKSYCLLLREVYLAAKKTDPHCRILNGGIANGIASVNHLYDNGGKGYFDILNIHIFESPFCKSSISKVNAYVRLAANIMKRNGDGDKKIWVTETGCPGVREGLETANWWLGKNPGEEEQAEWLREVYGALLKEKPVAKIFWAFLRDCRKHWDSGVDYFGLVRWDYSVKPAFQAYRQEVEDYFNNRQR